MAMVETGKKQDDSPAFIVLCSTAIIARSKRVGRLLLMSLTQPACGTECTENMSPLSIQSWACTRSKFMRLIIRLANHANDSGRRKRGKRIIGTLWNLILSE